MPGCTVQGGPSVPHIGDYIIDTLGQYCTPLKGGTQGQSLPQYLWEKSMLGISLYSPLDAR